MDNNASAIVKSSNEFMDTVADELIRSKSLLKEITSTLDQSQVEVNRLTQKKAAVTSQLQKFQNNLASVTKEEIKGVYTEAMDAQQRLLLMRGQLERIQEQQTGLEKYIDLLMKIQNAYQSNTFAYGSSNGKAEGAATLEMLINAQEAERQRLSRQMHDGPAQALSNFIVQTEIASKFFDIDPQKAREELEKLKTSAMLTFQKIRVYISDLRPMSLDDLGLIPTIKKFVSGIKEETGREITLTISGGEQKLDSFLEVYLFRAVQEFVNNAIKHNQDQLSKVSVEIELAIDNSHVLLVVRDSGQGFDPGIIEESHGLGLKVIKERAELLGGSFIINSADNSGSELQLNIPVEPGI